MKGPIEEKLVKTELLNRMLGQEIIGVRAEMETRTNHLEDAWRAEVRLERIIDECPLCCFRRWWSSR